MENQIIPKNEDFQIFDLWAKYKGYWPWFLFSLIVCAGIAFLLIIIVPESFKRSASVMIKEDSNITDISAAFTRNINQYQSVTNVNNEIEAFKSPQLMRETINRLNLTTSYTVKDSYTPFNDRLKSIELYAKSPIVALFPDASYQESFSFYVELLPDNVIILSKFTQENSEIEQSINAKLNDTVSTPIGRVMIAPTLSYSLGQHLIPIEVGKTNIDDVVEKFMENLFVTISGKESSVVVLELTDASVQRADDMLSVLIDAYNENWISYKNMVAVNTSQFINERLPLIEQELREIDDKMEQYKTQNLLTDVRSAASLYMKESSEYSGKISEMRNQISIAGFIKEYLNDTSKTSDLLPSNTGLNNQAIESQIKEYNTLLLKRDELMANSSEKNPLVVDMNNSLSAMKQSVIRTVDNLIITLNLQLKGLQEQETRATKNIASNPGQEKKLLSIIREQNTKESLYIYLLQKREENDMSLALNATNTRIISPPSGSTKPEKPKKMLIFLIAFAMGMGMPTGIIWIRSMLDTTIREKRDLNNLSLPLLGVVPLAGLKNRKNGYLYVRDKGKDIINETFRIIRTNMEFMCAKDKKVTLFTSLDIGAGKTFMSLNLAMSFALAGKKVALLDLDMRTATLSKLVTLPEIGISNYLNGTITDESWIIVKDFLYPGFDLIPTGITPSNPTELLLSDNLKKILEKLRTEYDYIFIDSTPVDMVADAHITGKFADFTILVVREGFTDRRTLPDIENIYRSGKFKSMALILNGSDHHLPSGKYYVYSDEMSGKTTMLPNSSPHPPVDKYRLLPIRSKSVK